MESVALRVMQLGAIAAVLSVTTFFGFELDRFFVPKELALHVTALVAGILVARAIGTRIDLLLAAFLLLTAFSALLATNRWLALRALAVSASGVLLFWTARALRDAGRARQLLNGLALAVVLAAITSLLQTYGIETTLFSESRAPGGTLGNRNFVAHVAAFGFPLLLLSALRARRASSYLIASLGAAIAAGSLVLTRSRAAWLAFGAVLFIVFVAMLLSPPLRRDGRTWRRLSGMFVLAVGGVAAALLIPNDLRWRSDNPYLESLERMADYREGSGRGRLVQYERSLRMAVSHPLFGAGPGNWAVVYPEHAARNDPSMNPSEPGMTFNPWPSSDWIAHVSERGPLAAIALLLAFALMALGAFRQLRGALDAEEGLAAMALLGTIAGMGVAGAFDAVLLLAVPAAIVWPALGALYKEDVLKRVPAFVPWIIVLIVAAGAVRSGMQLAAMQIYETRSTSLANAARIDPGNYRLRLRLARSGRRRERCEHALAARALYPNAEAAKGLSRNCGD